MKTLRFAWNGGGSLASQLAAGFSSASVRTAAHGRPIAMTLWRANELGLCIQSSMHDISERQEIGALQFTLVKAPFDDEEEIPLLAPFADVLMIEKLVIEDGGIAAESGVVLTAKDGERIVVVSGAYPYTLAVDGVSCAPYMFEPEFPLERYIRVAIE